MCWVVGDKFYPEASWGASYDAAEQRTWGGELQGVRVVVAVLLALLMPEIGLVLVGIGCQSCFLLVAWCLVGRPVWGGIWVVFDRIFLRGWLRALVRLVFCFVALHSR